MLFGIFCKHTGPFKTSLQASAPQLCLGNVEDLWRVDSVGM